MINVRRYNYFTWLDEILHGWNGGERLGERFLELGASDGTFLRLLLEAGAGSYGLGLDIVVPDRLRHTVHRSAILELQRADLCEERIPDEFGNFDTVFFMNMFYVLPDLAPVECFLSSARIPNLIVSLPRENALDRFDARRPGVNDRTRDFFAFSARCGYTERQRSATTRNYYLTAPGRVALGSLSPLTTRLAERFGSEPYYDLVWLEKL